jgi:hypothetical protein
MQRATLYLIVFLVLGVLGNAHGFDPMRIKVRTILPKEITTVGEAAQYYAHAIGYRLITGYPAPQESYKISIEPISPLARKNSIMAIEDAILEVLDERYFLVIDHENKLFSFKIGDQ